MKKSLLVAIGIQVVIMVSVLVPPLVDPRALFRGDYVILDYDIGNNIDLATAKQAQAAGEPLYIVVTTDRPAAFVRASTTKPELQVGEACLVGRAAEEVQWINNPSENLGRSIVQFPQISQFFVPEGTGRELEEDLNSMVAKLSVTRGCNAVIRTLEQL